MIALNIDDKSLQERVKVSQQKIGRGMPQDLSLSAKRAAFYCMEYTLPASTKGSQWPMDNFRDRIEADVMKAFPTKADGKWQASAYQLIKDNYREETAKEFWHEYRSGSQSSFDADNPERMDYEQRFDRLRKIPRRVAPEAYRELRKKRTIVRNRTRVLDPKAPAIAFPSEGSRTSFTRKRQDTIGLAKAGWYAVDTSLGGTRNYTRAANEEGRFVWPGQLRKLQGKFGSGIGAGTVNPNEAGGKWAINNRVRYSDEAIPDALRDKAFELARNAMRIIFELRFKNRKTYTIDP